MKQKGNVVTSGFPEIQIPTKYSFLITKTMRSWNLKFKATQKKIVRGLRTFGTTRIHTESFSRKGAESYAQFATTSTLPKQAPSVTSAKKW